MRALPSLLLSLTLTATIVGCREESRQALAIEELVTGSSRMVLYSLDPSSRHGFATHNDRVYHGFGIIGRAEVTDPAERQALAHALAESVRRPPDNVALCFNPRHAVTVQDGPRTVDFTICFECHQMRVDGWTADTSLVISPAQEPILDGALRRHGLRKSKT